MRFSAAIVPPLNPDEVYQQQVEQLAQLAHIPVSDLIVPDPTPAWPFRLTEDDRAFLIDCFIDPA